jgi:hypothetical protein
MAAPWNPPVKNEDFEFNVGLPDMSASGRYRVNPTLAAGDVKIIKDHGTGTPSNITTLPSVLNTSWPTVKVALTNTEMNADIVTILFRDQTDPPEWADLLISIPTTSA